MADLCAPNLKRQTLYLQTRFVAPFLFFVAKRECCGPPVLLSGWFMISFTRFIRILSSRRWLAVVLQAAVWAFIFSLPFLLRTSHDGESPRKEPGRPDQWQFVLQYAANCASWIALFYLNGWLLIPRLLNRRQYGRYAFWLLTLVLFLFAFNSVVFKMIMPSVPYRIGMSLVFFLFPSIFFIAVSTAISFFLEKLRTDRLSKERENENLKTELLFLRSQVSPHFLFNVLNNMVALARKGSDQLEPSLIKLSSLLRYMLYEAAEEKVPLNKELEYLQSYIDLQMQRFRKALQVNYTVGNIDDHYLLEPMLLIPFVENAFKHSITGVPGASVDISLRAEKSMLHLEVRNQFSPQSGEKDKSSGIGLQNVRRRLSLLYPDEHALLITDDKGWFTVSLTIKLH